MNIKEVDDMCSTSWFYMFNTSTTLPLNLLDAFAIFGNYEFQPEQHKGKMKCEGSLPFCFSFLKKRAGAWTFFFWGDSPSQFLFGIVGYLKLY